ncbi:hypothetical protein C7436_0527 [Marinobacter nauticus]|nr:hypothetical protein C7436_0527 [Marinobacter nauticus]
MTRQLIDTKSRYRGMAPELLYQRWRERLSGNPRLNMPSLADALNRIGFFLFTQLPHGRFEPLNGQRVHMIINQLLGNAQ